MQRTLLPGRFMFCALLGVLATGAACGGQDVSPIPEEMQIHVSAVPPPPINGGTLIVTSNDLAVASDPDRDLIWIADIENKGTPKKVVLHPNDPQPLVDEPGRLVEDAAGKVHVALRRGGAIVTVDPATAKITARRAVCPSPRGLAYESSTDLLHVACEGGELMTLPAAGGDATLQVRLGRDLRDVIVEGDHLLVSRFRSAELLVVQKDGTFTTLPPPPAFTPNNLPGQTYTSFVAWRTVAMPTGGAMMVHQRGMSVPITLAPGGYYQTAGCDGSIIHAGVSIYGNTTNPVPKSAVAFPAVALPVDVAVKADGSIAMVGAGSDVVIQTLRNVVEQETFGDNCTPTIVKSTVAHEPIAVAYSKTGRLIVQTRQPAIVEVAVDGDIASQLDLPGEDRADTAHDMFHRPPNGISGIACASCHPGGHEDGRAWVFTTQTGDSFTRRTQNIGLGGGLLDSAPFHWAGDLKDMSGLMSEVFVKRMGGEQPGPHHVALISKWLDQLPALPPSPSTDAAAVSRGAELFNSAEVGCAKCHNGAKLTNNETVDVGREMLFQVPSLISVGGRAPFMHDGCALTLRQRFTDTACGGGDKHGKTSQLTPAQIDDLVAYLESL